MSEPFLGQIVMFGGNFAPRNWALCDGQILPINNYQALFSLLGTIYGGDGRTTFGLPDLRGRVPMHPGNGPGLTPRSLGQKTGTESNTLNVTQLPSHTHTGTVKCVAGPGNSNVAANNFCSKDLGSQSGTYHSGPSDADMNSGAVTIGDTGGGQPVTNVQPVQCVNFIIALQGIYPSRN